MLEIICQPHQPPSMPIAPTIAPTIAVVACYGFLIQCIKPEAVTSTHLWQEDGDEQDFVAAIEKCVAVRRESNDLASPIWALLGTQKISKRIDDSRDIL
jgi:hypothetical protein